MRYTGTKQKGSIQGVLNSFVKADDKASFQRFVTKWNQYLEAERAEDREWGKACLEWAREVAPDESWMKIFKEKKKK